MIKQTPFKQGSSFKDSFPKSNKSPFSKPMVAPRHLDMYQTVYNGEYKPNVSTFPLITAKFTTYNVPMTAFHKFPNLHQGKALRSAGYVPIESFSRFFLTWAEKSKLKPLFGWVEGTSPEEQNKVERVAEEFRKKGLVEGCNFSENCTLHFMHIADFQPEFMSAVGLGQVFPERMLAAGRISLVFVITLKRLPESSRNCIVPEVFVPGKKQRFFTQKTQEKENDCSASGYSAKRKGINSVQPEFESEIRKKTKIDVCPSTPRPKDSDEQLRCDKNLQTIKKMLDVIGTKKDDLINRMNETFYKMSKDISKKVGVTQFDDEFLLTFKDRTQCQGLYKNFSVLNENFEKFTSILQEFSENPAAEEEVKKLRNQQNIQSAAKRNPLQAKSASDLNITQQLEQEPLEESYSSTTKNLESEVAAAQKVIVNIRNCDPTELDEEEFWSKNSLVSSLSIQLNREKLDGQKLKNLERKLVRLAPRLRGVKTVSLIIKTSYVSPEFLGLIADFFSEIKERVNNLILHFAKTNIESQAFGHLLEVFKRSKLYGLTIYLRETQIGDGTSRDISSFLNDKPNYLKYALRSLNINILSSKMSYGCKSIQETLNYLKSCNQNLKISFNFL
jgi:hypothetical protein